MRETSYTAPRALIAWGLNYRGKVIRMYFATIHNMVAYCDLQEIQILHVEEMR